MLDRPLTAHKYGLTNVRLMMLSCAKLQISLSRVGRLFSRDMHGSCVHPPREQDTKWSYGQFFILFFCCNFDSKTFISHQKYKDKKLYDATNKIK